MLNQYNIIPNILFLFFTNIFLSLRTQINSTHIRKKLRITSQPQIKSKLTTTTQTKPESKPTQTLRATTTSSRDAPGEGHLQENQFQAEQRSGVKFT